MFSFRKIIFVVITALLLLCASDISYGESQSELINSLKNEPDKHKRLKLALKLSQFNNPQTSEVFYERIKNDSSSKVQVECVRGLKKILSKSLTEKLKNEKRHAIAAQESERMTEVYRSKLRPFLEKTYVFKGKHPSDVKAEIVGFFRSSDKNKDFMMLQNMLREHCKMSLNERKELQNRGLDGDFLLGTLLATMGSRKGRTLVTPEGFHYGTNIEGKFIPLLEKDLKNATGDYELSLLVILGEIGTHEKYDLKQKKLVKFFSLDPAQLQKLDDLLIQTESRFLKREGLRVLYAYKHQFSAGAKKIIEDLQKEAKNGVK